MSAMFSRPRLLTGVEWTRQADEMLSLGSYQRRVGEALRSRADVAEAQRVSDDLRELARLHDVVAEHYERCCRDYRDLADEARRAEASSYQDAS